MNRSRNKTGSILILAMWTLIFLTLIVAQVGLKIRQRVNLLSRIEKNAQLRHLAKAGVKKAIAAIRFDFQRNGQVYTPGTKSYRHNNPGLFGEITLGNGTASVMYEYDDDVLPEKHIRYGFVDEESKVNLNTAPPLILFYLIKAVMNVSDEEAKIMAESIIDWRERGQSRPEGFYSDDFYTNLKFPYPPKQAYFDVPDELSLVRGFSPDVYNKLKPYFTVYGDGRVNINTASRNVLLGLGMDATLVDKILMVRRGVDATEATPDDYTFQKSFDIASEMSQFVKLEPQETQQIDRLNADNKIKTDSYYFFIQSRGRLENGKDMMNVECVYSIQQNRIEYWQEK